MSIVQASLKRKAILEPGCSTRTTSFPVHLYTPSASVIPERPALTMENHHYRGADTCVDQQNDVSVWIEDRLHTRRSKGAYSFRIRAHRHAWRGIVSARSAVIDLRIRTRGDARPRPGGVNPDPASNGPRQLLCLGVGTKSS